MRTSKSRPGTRFAAGQRIVATRSGHSGEDSLAEVLHVHASEAAELYRVRWPDGLETFFVPDRRAHDRRLRDVGPPAGMPERRSAPG